MSSRLAVRQNSGASSSTGVSIAASSVSSSSASPGSNHHQKQSQVRHRRQPAHSQAAAGVPQAQRPAICLVAIYTGSVGFFASLFAIVVNAVYALLGISKRRTGANANAVSLINPQDASSSSSSNSSSDPSSSSSSSRSSSTALARSSDAAHRRAAIARLAQAQSEAQSQSKLQPHAQPHPVSVNMLEHSISMPTRTPDGGLMTHFSTRSSRTGPTGGREILKHDIDFGISSANANAKVGGAESESEESMFAAAEELQCSLSSWINRRTLRQQQQIYSDATDCTCEDSDARPQQPTSSLLFKRGVQGNTLSLSGLIAPACRNPRCVERSKTRKVTRKLAPPPPPLSATSATSSPSVSPVSSSLMSPVPGGTARHAHFDDTKTLKGVVLSRDEALVVVPDTAMLSPPIVPAGAGAKARKSPGPGGVFRVPLRAVRDAMKARNSKTEQLSKDKEGASASADERGASVRPSFAGAITSSPTRSSFERLPVAVESDDNRGSGNGSLAKKASALKHKKSNSVDGGVVRSMGILTPAASDASSSPGPAPPSRLPSVHFHEDLIRGADPSSPAPSPAALFEEFKKEQQQRQQQEEEAQQEGQPQKTIHKKNKSVRKLSSFLSRPGSAKGSREKFGGSSPAITPPPLRTSYTYTYMCPVPSSSSSENGADEFGALAGGAGGKGGSRNSRSAGLSPMIERDDEAQNGDGEDGGEDGGRLAKRCVPCENPIPVLMTLPPRPSGGSRTSSASALGSSAAKEVRRSRSLIFRQSRTSSPSLLPTPPDEDKQLGQDGQPKKPKRRPSYGFVNACG